MFYLIGIILIIILIILVYIEYKIKNINNKSYIQDLLHSVDLKSHTIGELEEKNRELIAKCHELSIEIKNLNEALLTEKNNNQKILSQKKSSEVKLGQIGEQLIPFLDEFPYNSEDLHFLGMPVDYIHFDTDEGKITFIEIKTGDAKLSKKQRIIKNIITSGRVFWDEIRISTKGIKTKNKEENKDG